MAESLKKNDDFRRIYRKGRAMADGYLVMYQMPGEKEGPLRVGISVSKKVGNSVIRHRVKRLIRESFRLEEARFNSSLDLVVVAKSAAKGQTFDCIRHSVISLGERHGIVER